MRMEVSQRIIDGLDDILNTLSESRAVHGYRFLTGDPAGAHLNGYDDSQWNYSYEPVKFKRHQGTTWFRFNIEAPEKILDIPVSGAGIRLSSFLLAPVAVYADGDLKLSERTWMDFKVPEIVLTENAAPGQVFRIAARMELGEFCYYDSSFSMNFIIDRVEDAEFEISSFKEELSYACRFREVRNILPEVFRLLEESLEKNEGALKLVEKIRLSREMLKPMAEEAKKRKVHLVGHAHIDMDWFWSIEETHDLVRRDFGTMTRIMEEIPEFKFSQSQCATYEMAERLYPEIFEKMKKFIKAGNWDATASTWVEGDMNMASGESIVRHLLYSKKYLRDKFGIEPRIMWCPDTFGHSGNTPQIARKAGIDYYFFMRCGKESRTYGRQSADFRKYGAETPLFWWEGIDGTRILAFNAVYNSDMNAAGIFNISGKMEDKYGLDNSMYVYGTGDHGGGPTRRDIRRAKQLDSYSTVPKVEFSTTHSFFDSVINADSPSVPIEKGELNYVFDGCYTTHADIKRYNRKCESMLAGTEVLAAAGSLCGLDYERDKIEECWKAALFNQFHDIFDGSGVKATYAYASEIAEKALDMLGVLSDKYLAAIGGRIRTSAEGIPVILFNTTGWERSECIRISLPGPMKGYSGAVDHYGVRLPSQQAAEGLYVFAGKIPALGYKVIYLDREEYKPAYTPIDSKGEFYKITTKYYMMEIRKDSGEIVSLYDRINGRNVVGREEIGWYTKKGILNTLQVHYEVPTPMSAWTIGPSGRIRCLVSNARSIVKEDGPVVKIITFEHEFDSSVISQDIIIYNDSPRIDFSTSVNWNETGGPEKEAPMLRACFVPDIDNSRVTCEIPFGAADRACRDMEVPALNWIDISDGEYGFSLLNDCKHGHRVKGNFMELALIRSGWQPDPESDAGTHEFIYSIYPHRGSWNDCDVIKEGYCLNNGIIARITETNGNGNLPETAGLVEISGKNVAVSAFKLAEAGDGFILRLYNGDSNKKEVKVKLGFNTDSVLEVDLIEERTYGVINTDGCEFGFDMGGFEIKTFKLKR